MNNPQLPIFIFGSNTQGRHGKGAALYAVQYHGATYGVPMGRQGNSYAIITKELRKDAPSVTIEFIETQLEVLRIYMSMYSDSMFQLTKIGCGLAGFEEEDIKHMCNSILCRRHNLIYPEGW